MSTQSANRDFADVLFVLWARRTVIVSCVLLAAVLALAFSQWLPKSYRATATLIITGSKIPTATIGEATRPDSRLYADTYAQLIRGRAIAKEVVDALGRDQAPLGLSVDRLSQSLQIRAIPGTLLLTVSLDLSDPGLAARVVNAQTERAVALSKTLATNELTDTRLYLEAQVAAGRTELDRREEALRALKANLRHEESVKQLEYLLEQRGALASAMNEADQQATEADAEVKAFDKALQTETKTVVLTKSIVDDPAFQNATQVTTDREIRSIVGLQMRSEELNPVFTASEPIRLRALARAAGATARRVAVQRQLSDCEASIRTLERGLADKQAALTAAQREFDLAKNAYESFARSYENARLSVAASAAELRVVDPAVPEGQPVGPRTALNVAVAITTSFVLCVFALLFIDHLRLARPGQPDDLGPSAGDAVARTSS